MERYIPIAHTQPKPPRAWLLFLQAGYKRGVLGTTILSNGKEHFGPTERNDQTGQRGPPSKLVPNIPVRPNRNGPFHLMSQPNYRNFGLNGKRSLFPKRSVKMIDGSEKRNSFFRICMFVKSAVNTSLPNLQLKQSKIRLRFNI